MKEEKILCGIYKVTSPTEKIYVGGSIDIIRRKREYDKLECKQQIKLYNSLKKYGFKNHKFEIIHLCKEKLLNELEMHYIQLLDTFNTPHGLNLTRGGDGVMRDKHHTKETIEKIGKSLKGKNKKNKTKEHKEKIRQSKLGKTWEILYGIEKANKLKQDAAKRGRERTGKNHPMFNKHHTKKTLKLMREVKLGKISPLIGQTYEEIYGVEKAKEKRDKISKTLTGKRFPNGYEKKIKCNIVA